MFSILQTQSVFRKRAEVVSVDETCLEGSPHMENQTCSHQSLQGRPELIQLQLVSHPSTGAGTASAPEQGSD